MIGHKGFKKVHEDEHHAVLKHPQGHEIHVAKKSLSGKVLKQLDAIPMAEGGWISKIGKALAPEPYVKEGTTGGKPLAHIDPDKAKAFVKSFRGYADGGDVMPQQDLSQMLLSPEDRLRRAEQNMGIPSDNVSLGAQQTEHENAPASAVTPQLMQQISASPEGQQMASQATMQAPGLDEMNQVTHKQQIAIADEAKAQKNLAHQQIKADAAHIIATQNLQKEHAVKLAELQRERAALQKDVADGHIDPNHYLNSQTTGQKISTAIGLFLGGINTQQGAVNPAAKFIDDQIERDIAAQKANLGKKENLLSAFQHQFGNLDDATKMTKVFLNDQLSSRLHREAARANDPIVMARAQQMIQQKELENMQMASAVAQSQAQMKMKQQLASSGASNINPEMLEEKDRERFVPALGGVATSKEGAAKLNELAGATNTATSGIQELLQLSKTPRSELSLEKRAQADTIAQTVRAALRVPILGPGTVNEGERKLMERIVADPTAIFSLDKLNQVRLETLARRLNINMQQQGKAQGINSKASPNAQTNPNALQGYRK